MSPLAKLLHWFGVVGLQLVAGTHCVVLLCLHYIQAQPLFGAEDQKAQGTQQKILLF